MDSTWLLRLETTGTGPRLAVKDCIDVAGTVTTAGSRAVAATAVPARLDAPVVASARAQGARIVGKTNLVELCRRADGLNAWTATPANPLDAGRIPGGSSSGSAVAVATGQADVAYGTDTGGSIRVPAACCGVAGLKTTAGRLPLDGITELSRTLDTVGPLARDVAGLVVGMRLAEPGFTVAVPPPDRAPTAARLRPADVDPAVDAAVDEALEAAGVRWTDVEVPDWADWCEDADTLLVREGWLAQRQHLDHPELLEPRHAEDIALGEAITPARVVASRRTAVQARAVLSGLLDRFDVLALPTLPDPTPRFADVSGLTYLTVPLNLTGHPAVAMPLPTLVDGMPVSLQLVGGLYGEEALLGWAAHVELARPG